MIYRRRNMANTELKEKIKQALITKLELDDDMKAALDIYCDLLHL